MTDTAPRRALGKRRRRVGFLPRSKPIIAAATVFALFGLSACAPATTDATFTVTATADGAESVTEVPVAGIQCLTSSVSRLLTSEAKTAADEYVFLAKQPIPDRAAYLVTLWFDDQWFVSDETFDATDGVSFEDLPGTLSPSVDGAAPTGGGVPATLTGTVSCP